MNLLKRYEKIRKEQKEIESLKEEKNLKLEINNLVKAILDGEDRFFTQKKTILKKFNIKKYKSARQDRGFGFIAEGYSFKITKVLIEKVEEYLEGEENE